jgi:hypothetical protein
MAKLKRLQDVYRFPGFLPCPKVRGLFGDPYALVITLQRRRKNTLRHLWTSLPQSASLQCR